MTLIALFPGQGSQTIGMLSDFEAKCPEIRETFSEASESLGYNLWAVIQDGSGDRLSMTEITQPLLLTAGIALFRAWTNRNGQCAAYMTGHSLGEYTALTAAGSLSLADAVRLVRSRGQFMQTAVPAGTGAMAAVIGLDDEAVQAVCAAVAFSEGQVIEAVNFNAPGQVVIAGHATAIEVALAQLKDAGAKKAIPLPVSAPFHCTLMQPAAEKLQAELDAIMVYSPQVPVIQNLSIKPETDTTRIRTQLIKQTFSPVRWTNIVRSFDTLGISKAIEFGPGAVLCGLAKRIQTSVKHLPVNTFEKFDLALQETRV